MIYVPQLTDKEIQENQKRFSERANVYNKLGMDFLLLRRLFLEKAGLLEGNILEIGTGNGHTAIALREAGYKFKTIDINKESLKITALNLAYRGLLSGVEFYVMDGKQLAFEDASFQAVVVINLFHHVDEVDEMLSEIDRVLCARGKLIMADFNKEGLKIIDSVHKNEGRVHENSGVSKKYVYSYFNGLGYNITEFNDKYHWALIAEKI